MPNAWVWALLSDEERRRIDAGDRFHNTQRSDYADPRQYQGGNDFDRPVRGRMERRRARALQRFLDRTQPHTVLEVGPGSGHLTRLVVEHPSVRRYIAVDINAAFLEHLRPRLAALPRHDFSYELVHGTVDTLPDDLACDAVVMMSTVHHIPDRRSLFAQLANRLTIDGRIFAVDPTHYLLRWRQLLQKVRRPGYLAAQLEAARAGRLSTHAMCQRAEYLRVARHAGLEIVTMRFFDLPKRIRRWRGRGFPLGPVTRWTSQEILVECRRPAFPPTPLAVRSHRLAIAAVRALLLVAYVLRR
jgi:SAM-dependent methyltransferase